MNNISSYCHVYIMSVLSLKSVLQYFIAGLRFKEKIFSFYPTVRCKVLCMFAFRTNCRLQRSINGGSIMVIFLRFEG